MKYQCTKQVLKAECKRLTKVLYEMYNYNLDKLQDIYRIYTKNLDGRLYIHSKATKAQLEGLYEDLINYISDNHLGIE